MAGRRRQKMLSVVLVATAVFLVAVMHLASVIEDDVFTTGTQDLIPATIDPKPFAVIVGVPAVNTSSVTKPTSVTRTTPLPIKKPWNEPLGPGERGQGVKLTEDDVPDGAERELYRKLYDKYQYNAYLSDVVSLHRSLPLNVTDPMCLAKRYDQPLPTASVVVPFRDERRSMLLRTVHSVLDRSPPHLLKEVILVDDGSESDELKTSLDVYVALLERVKLLRLPESKGLMVSRNTGIRASSGDVIIVMDCHVEVAPGWLEPLLDRVREEPRALVFPSMDIVLENSMEYRYLPLTSERTMPAFNFYLDQAMTFLFSDMWRKRQDATRPVPSVSEGIPHG